MKEVVIVSACRTAIGAFGGTLKDSHASKLAAVAMKEAIKIADERGHKESRHRTGHDR